MANTCTIVSPLLGATLEPDDAVVVEATASGGLTNVIITITEVSGEPTIAFVMVDGFTAGFTGTVESITDGIRVSIRRPFGWGVGPLDIDAETHAAGGGTSTLFTHTYSETDTATNSGSGGDLKVLGVSDGIDFASWGTGTLRLTVTGEGGASNSTGGMPWSMVAGPASPGPDDILAYSFADGALLPAFGSITFNDNSSGSGNPYVEFDGPGVAGYINISVAYDFFSFSSRTASIRNFTVTITGSSGPSVVTDSREAAVVPTTPIDGAPDLVGLARSRVIIQYREAPRLNAMIGVHASILQQVVNCLVGLNASLRDPTVGTGVNLEHIGELVGQTRAIGNGDDATNGELVVLIGARISRNMTKTLKALFLDALVQFFNAPVIMNDSGGMTLIYTVVRAPTSDEIALLNQDIVARPMGVKVVRSFISATTGYFGFSTDTGALGFSEISDGGTTGGFWNELF